MLSEADGSIAEEAGSKNRAIIPYASKPAALVVAGVGGDARGQRDATLARGLRLCVTGRRERTASLELVRDLTV